MGYNENHLICMSHSKYARKKINRMDIRENVNGNFVYLVGETVQKLRPEKKEEKKTRSVITYNISRGTLRSSRLGISSELEEGHEIASPKGVCMDGLSPTRRDRGIVPGDVLSYRTIKVMKHGVKHGLVCYSLHPYGETAYL